MMRLELAGAPRRPSLRLLAAALALVATAGLVIAVLQVGSLGALIATSYGLILAVSSPWWRF